MEKAGSDIQGKSSVIVDELTRLQRQGAYETLSTRFPVNLFLLIIQPIF